MKFKFLLVLIPVLFVSQHLSAAEDSHNISVYTGTFDVIDKEGDDQTTLIGIEHKNKDLFRDGDIQAAHSVANLVLKFMHRVSSCLCHLLYLKCA